METAFIGAMAGVLGSIVGGSATVMTAWITQKTLNKRALIGAEVRKRKILYGGLISECSNLVTDSLTRTLDEPETLLPAYALLNRIRLTASVAVLNEESLTAIKRLRDAATVAMTQQEH